MKIVAGVRDSTRRILDNDKKLSNFLLVLLVIGVWMLVFQNSGIISSLRPLEVQVSDPVTVTGSVDVDSVSEPVTVTGSVDVDSVSEPVTVTGSVDVDSVSDPVTVTGSVDVNNVNNVLNTVDVRISR